MKYKIMWVLAFLPALITTAVMPFMQDKVPMHYDVSGNIDRWGSKYENYIFPVMILAITLFWNCFLRYFRKKAVSSAEEKAREEAKNNEKVIYVVAVGQIVMFSIMHCFFMYSAFWEAKQQMTEMAIDSSVVVNVIMAIFIILIGNILPKTKRNSVAGVRTVWSMESDETWAASNRFGGVVFMVAGVLIIITSVLVGGIASTLIMLGIIIAAAIVSVAYSYRVYKKWKAGDCCR